MLGDFATDREEETRLRPSPLFSSPSPIAPLPNLSESLDAGALFVLESKGSWQHAGYHLTSSIVIPSLLSLPFAMGFLGWAAGTICLAIGAVVSFYSYNLLSLVLEHHADLGQRHLRFRDMATHILGPKWGYFYVAPTQFVVCYGSVIGYILLGGQSIKVIYVVSSPNGTMELYQFIVIFGIFTLVLDQMPSFHSLRHITLLSLILVLAYCTCATVGAVYVGYSSKAPHRDYSLSSDTADLLFGIFNAIAVIACNYGNGIIPEIQATLAPPVKGKMFKGLCVCYAVGTVTFFSVAISGYWAFGNRAAGNILSNFLIDWKPLLPRWLLVITNVFTLLQVSAVTVVYLQPMNEMLEAKFGDPESKQFSARNIFPRLLLRSLSVVISTVLAAMLPFFGDINAVIGAFGFIPLDFVLPVIFYNVTFKPSRWSLIFWINTTIAVVFAGLGVMGAISTVRQISLDVKTYRLFANV